ncbi:MAG: hypothetical protein UY05_C0004G0012 [Candidatus Peregrinibacteria bacterium GW2011_GWA2_47_7]|nr:MAG: hypothetical protein UY05_C0004G0012 [Candidatus Peregrinibacteria bacterium GW2011_GWA2_47_7]
MKRLENPTSRLWKKIILFGIVDLVLVLVLFDVLVGKLTFNILPVQSSYSSPQEENQRGAAEKITNIAVRNFEVKTKNDVGRFAIGAEIDFICKIEADNVSPESTFSAVIKSGTEEIIRKQLTGNYQEKNTWTITGAFTPTKSGTEPFACRADTEKAVEENNERDNREMLFLFIANL